MFQFNEEFLKTVGLESMPEDQKETFLSYAQEQFEIRIGESMSEGLSEEKLNEFEQLSNNDAVVIESVLSRYPGYEKDFTFRRLIKNGATEAGAKSDFAVVKWLDENYPNYTQKINEILMELQEEIYNQRNSILLGE